MSHGFPPCEACGDLVGSRGHLCRTGRSCRGSRARANRILEAGVDGQGNELDSELRAWIMATVAYHKDHRA